MLKSNTLVCRPSGNFHSHSGVTKTAGPLSEIKDSKLKVHVIASLYLLLSPFSVHLNMFRINLIKYLLAELLCSLSSTFL